MGHLTETDKHFSRRSGLGTQQVSFYNYKLKESNVSRLDLHLLCRYMTWGVSCHNTDKKSPGASRVWTRGYSVLQGHTESGPLRLRETEEEILWNMNMEWGRVEREREKNKQKQMRPFRYWSPLKYTWNCFRIEKFLIRTIFFLLYLCGNTKKLGNSHGERRRQW